MRVLLTGGMGFIGSHTAVVLQEGGHEPVLYDNLSNADRAVTGRIEQITGKAPKFIEGDIRDQARMEEVLRDEKIDAVIHFAGLKAVGESVVKPLEYYDNNIIGTLRLLEAMRATGVKRLIFSSSSTVYGTPQSLPLRESDPTGEATNPYGRTKLQIEEILSDLCRADPTWSCICLRYFNPIGAHPSGLIGEDPNGIPNNLMPYVARVASGRLPVLNVFGNDYDTPDGTGVRDFIHVMDLARGHAAALPYCMSHEGWKAVNLGCGRGYSVLEIVAAFEKASGRKVPVNFAPRRAGDIAANWADPSLARELFGWEAQCNIEDMCRDGWNFEQHRAAELAQKQS
ncbi:UDP-glucose 4-epimerase GalE [Sutterella sp.]|uniref:UDP-glucose 4-epimerase GalE n=1 Tax=Sutterella sp. TaxID=1981025 RepID=UPI0026DF4716|nr:UDP-glucose 4-epimerase GalE [Sutterella sp.]MDO5530674.1 UDP-glucose 4-epimerase GalE [Sutterella sp.]